MHSLRRWLWGTTRLVFGFLCKGITHAQLKALAVGHDQVGVRVPVQGCAVLCAFTSGAFTGQLPD